MRDSLVEGEVGSFVEPEGVIVGRLAGGVVKGHFLATIVRE